MDTLINILYFIVLVLIVFKLFQWFVEVPNYLEEINDNLNKVLIILSSKKEDNKEDEDNGVEL